MGTNRLTICFELQNNLVFSVKMAIDWKLNGPQQRVWRQLHSLASVNIFVLFFTSTFLPLFFLKDLFTLSLSTKFSYSGVFLRIEFKKPSSFPPATSSLVGCWLFKSNALRLVRFLYKPNHTKRVALDLKSQKWLD